jgi:acetylornithine deacetylase/succinyl-diaminopimelate desuccinylase-like protein
LEEVYAYVDSRSEDYVQELVDFLKQPSISAQEIGLFECSRLLQKMMTASGIPTRIMPVEEAPPIVYGELKSKKPARTLLCYGHYDVQPPEPLDEWIYPPFDARIEDGIIYARGATDDKSGVLAFVKAAEAFLNTTGDVPVNLKFVFEGEEEIGSPHLEDWVIENADMLKADGLHCLDGGSDAGSNKPHVAIGNKAILKIELIAHGGTTDVHSNMAAWVANPAWRLVWALASLKAPNERILIDGWYDKMKKLDAKDRKLIKDAAADLDREQLKSDLGVDTLLLNRSSRDLIEYRWWGTTCTINGIVGGYTGEGSKTIVPRVASAKLDFRCPPYLEPAAQLRKLRAHLKRKGFGDIEVKADYRPHPWLTAPTEPISKAVISAATEIFGAAPTVNGCTAEGAFSYNLNIPCVLTGFGPPKPNLHAPNENMPVDYYIRGIKYAASIMQKFATS